MTSIIMHGCNGRMGAMITSLAADMQDVKIVAGVDITGEQKYDYPVFKSIAECDVKADVIIDFSTATAVEGLLDYAVNNKTGIVLCTTGLSEEVLQKVSEASKVIPILRSGNMSLGINLIMKLLRQISEQLTKAGFEPEIVEKHHNKKLDAPSGTAVMLAEAINDGLSENYDIVYDRSERRMERPKNEIGVSAVRGGSIVGIHEVTFAGPDEVIEIKHTAYSRAIFANGSLAAAKVVAAKDPGMYTMDDVIE